MTPSPTWEQWDGYEYPSEKLNPVVYYYPGIVDIEDPDNLNALITEIHQDGVAPSKKAARALLEAAIVIHGQVKRIDGDLHFYAGTKFSPDSADYHSATDATWVEVDEYDD